MAQFVVAALILLIVGVLAILVMIGLERPCRAPPDSQTNVWPPSSSPDAGHKKLVQLETPEHPGLKRSQNPRAMLTASNDIWNSSTYLLWESNKGNVYCKGGFIYDNGSLVVPRDGQYRIFLQITYRHPENCAEIFQCTNTVSYYGDDYQVDRNLLSSVDTIPCNEFTQKSLYTSGLFELKAKDTLHVTSSCPRDIVINEHLVFFGAEFLPD